MKTYVISWYDPRSWHINKRCRCKLLPHPMFFFGILGLSTVLDCFIYIYELAPEFTPMRDFRLYRSGKLIARQATYQGV